MMMMMIIKLCHNKIHNSELQGSIHLSEYNCLFLLLFEECLSILYILYIF